MCGVLLFWSGLWCVGFCIVTVCGVMFGSECLFALLRVVSCVLSRVTGSCVVWCFKGLIRVIGISLEFRCC